MAYRQRMSDLLEQVRNPKQEVQEAGPSDYLKSKMTDTQINNIKKTWAMKTAKDVTPAIKKMIKDLDIPTQLAIKHANINQISKLVEEDHEISMAQGELKAISAKANDLANMLSTKSDDTDELEAWVQSKITKAKDYIASVSDYLTHNPGHQNEELVKENFSPSQIARLKKEYEVLRGKKISVANANKLSQMFKNIPDSGLKDIFKADIPFLSVMAMSKMIQKGIPRPAGVKLNLEEVEILDEATQDYLEITEGAIDSKKFDSLKRGDTMTITYNSTMSGSTKQKFVVKSKSRSAKYNTDKVTMYPDGKPNMARYFLYKRANGDVSMALGDMAASMMKVEEVAEGRMSEIDAMVKAGKSAAEIAKELKLNVRDVKAILGEEKEDEAEKQPSVKEEPKEDDKEKLKTELEKKDAEIAALKQKAETEKAKTVKKETEKLVNPETGEPLLQVGIAYKHLKDKMSKQQSEHFEQYMVEYTTQQIKMAYGVANDKRYKGGNYSGAVKAIEKIAKGLSNHPDVMKVLKRTNENIEEMAKDDAYAIGMSAAKKKYNDEPPLDKKTIKKGHEIADKIMKKEYKTLRAEGKMPDIDALQKQGKGAEEIAKLMKLPVKTVKQILGEYSGYVDIRGRLSNTQLDNIKKTWAKKSYKDVTKGLRDMMKDMDPGSKAAIRAKNINVLSKLVDENKNHPAKEVYESITAVKNKAEKTGMPYSILKKVYDRGMAAWRGGHRPGATQVQWALARVNSFVTKSSGTWGGADKDLAKQVRGK